VLYLRHKLQKGFLSRDQAPKEEEMADMDDYFHQLVAMGDLEANMIRSTKINKVLKAILKLDNIPKNDQYKFTDRSTTLLAEWNKTLGVTTTEPAAPTPTTAEAPKPTVNGTGSAGEPATSAEPEKETKTEVSEPPVAEPASEAKAEEKADVSMTDAAPAGETTEPSTAAPASTEEAAAASH
jgi:hypothetical protein